jgi:hypothetical protein
LNSVLDDSLLDRRIKTARLPQNRLPVGGGSDSFPALLVLLLLELPDQAGFGFALLADAADLLSLDICG